MSSQATVVADLEHDEAVLIGEKLKKAINSADIAKLQECIVTLCERVPGNAELVASLLLANDRDSTTEPEESDTEPEVSDPQPFYVTCGRCGEEYDLNGSNNESCIYHPGQFLRTSWTSILRRGNPYSCPMHLTGYVELDCDSVAWYDWDQDQQGRMDTPMNREQLPEGFKWSCCGGTYKECDGCEEDAHLEVSRKRRRFVY